MAKILVNDNDGNRYPNVRDMRGVSPSELTDALGDSLAITGLISIVTETGVAETVSISSTLTMASNSTLYLGPGITLQAATGFSGVLLSSTSTSNVRLTGDGVIVCTAGTAPTFTSVSGLSVDVRIEDENGERLGYLSSGSWQKVRGFWSIRITGSGTCVVDIKDDAGNVVEAVDTFTAIGLKNHIESPSADDKTAFARFTLTGSCAVEVI